MTFVSACGSDHRASEAPSTTDQPVTTSAPVPTWEPTTPLPTVRDLDGLVVLLEDHGVTCEHVDVENEGATAVPGGPRTIAMCYRAPGLDTLELSIYASGADRDRRRRTGVVLDCTRAPTMRALDGQLLHFAEGTNFDLRAAESQVSIPASLARLDAATIAIARRARLGLGTTAFRCSG